MDREKIIEAIRKATNGTFIGDQVCSTILGWIPEYDEEGRQVSCDPNFHDSQVRIDGTTYHLTVHKWTKVIWNPLIGERGNRMLLIAHSIDELVRNGDILYYSDEMPDYAKEWDSKRRQEYLDKREERLNALEKDLDAREASMRKAEDEFEKEKAEHMTELTRIKNTYHETVDRYYKVCKLFEDKSIEVMRAISEDPKLLSLYISDKLYVKIRNAEDHVITLIDSVLHSSEMSAEQRTYAESLRRRLSDGNSHIYRTSEMEGLIQEIRKGKNRIIDNSFSDRFLGNPIHHQILKFESKMADAFENGWINALMTGIAIHNYIPEDKLREIEEYEKKNKK